MMASGTTTTTPELSVPSAANILSENIIANDIPIDASENISMIEKFFCRICTEDASKEALAIFCNCSSPDDFTHVSCLEKRLSDDDIAVYSCDVCNYIFEVERVNRPILQPAYQGTYSDGCHDGLLWFCELKNMLFSVQILLSSLAEKRTDPCYSKLVYKWTKNKGERYNLIWLIAVSLGFNMGMLAIMIIIFIAIDKLFLPYVYTIISNWTITLIVIIGYYYGFNNLTRRIAKSWRNLRESNQKVKLVVSPRQLYEERRDNNAETVEESVI